MRDRGLGNQAEERYKNRMTLLLLGLEGEQKMMEALPFMVMSDIDSDKKRWCLASTEYNLNPFGKLVKKPARYLPNGETFEHKKHYHGWFASLRCSEEFYNEHKEDLDKFDVTNEKHFKTDYLPTWM